MNIGFIAMSGVRIYDPELLQLGMTLPGFLERGQTIASLPSLGLLTLAGMTPEHHNVRYLEIDQIHEMNEWPDFDLVALSTFTARAYDAYEVAGYYRSKGAKVVIGGLHATLVPDEALEHVDAVMAGEGELCWHQIIRDAEEDNLQGIYRSQPEEFDLDEAPMPAFELLDPERYNRLTVQTTRGCPLRCSFCAASIWLTAKYKRKQKEKVLNEIDRIRQLWSRPFLEFADDNSFVTKRYWKELLPELAKREVAWFTETDISVAEDDELLRLMRQAGCKSVLIGLESPVSEGLKGMELRNDWKHKKLPWYKEAVQRIQSHGIRVIGCFVLGLDGQTPEIFDKVYDFAIELELFDVQVTLQTPFPGTPLYDNLQKSGRMLEDRPWHKATLFDLTYEPEPMSRQELEEGFRDMVARLYAEDLTKWRQENFKNRYLAGTGSGF